MSKIILCTVLCGVLVGPVWAKGHHGAPMMPPGGAYSPKAAAAQQRAFNHAAANQQRALHHAAVNQQRAVEHAVMTQAKMQQHAIRHAPPPPGGFGPRGIPHGRGYRMGPGPSDMRHWRRGPAPHARYRSCWYDDVWYDAYGYPYYYGTTVVTPPPPPPVVVAPPPPPVVVTPPPPPVVVTPPPPPPPVVVY